ncbi:MAG: hypothetical protein A2Y73_07680 [Chloroflexi bacterium RBG_13_56_8]|nr:MAG: hypothetical protein A2Y73_07680 [Chloroflexi bacterium RBG_13_56_8]
MEVEAKFVVPDEETFRLLREVDHLAGYALSPAQLQEIHDTYLDTAERAVLASGYVFRRRDQDGNASVTLKGITGADGPVYRREELEATVPAECQSPGQWPASPVRDRVLQIIRDAELVSLFDLWQKRVLRMVSWGERLVAELSLGDVRIGAGRSESAYLELEVELTPQGTEDDLATIVACLRDEWCLEPESRSKFDQWLALWREKRPWGNPLAVRADVKRDADAFSSSSPSIPAVDLELDDTMDEAARKTLYFFFQHMLYHERGIRTSENIEELHDMRVAVRRMRAALRLFQDYVNIKRMRPFAKGLQRTGQALRVPRDLDVFWEKTQRYLDGLPAKKQGDLEPLRLVWEVEREKAREAMLAYLDSERYISFKERLSEFLQVPGAAALPPLSEKGEPVPRRVRHVLPKVVYNQLAAMRAYDEWVVGPDVPPGRLHQLRIAAKRPRYTFEFFEKVLRPEVKDLIKELKGLQDHLGDLQDAVVASDLLRDFLTRGTWGHDLPKTKGEKALSEPIVAPGVAAYLVARQVELKRLLDTFPEVWARIQSPDFSQLVAAALTGL